METTATFQKGSLNLLSFHMHESTSQTRREMHFTLLKKFKKSVQNFPIYNNMSSLLSICFSLIIQKQETNTFTNLATYERWYLS